MNRTRIQKRRATIEKKLAEWNKELIELQHQCPHAEAIATPGADTGNFCRADDTFWTMFKCPDCGKVWTVYHN